MKKCYLILALLTVLFIATAASAAWVAITGNPVSISSLQGNPFTFGDKQISNIALTGIASSGGAIAPTTNSVYIQGGQDSTTGNYGLRFLLSWIAGPGQTVNADIQFEISVLPSSNYYIKDVGMDITGASATGTGLVAVGETVRNAAFPDGSVIAQISCAETPNGNGAQLQASAEFTPVKEIWIWSKDISITGGTDGTAHLSEFYQFYSQTQVPEPATIMLLSLGMAALLRKKRLAVN
jgi:hypothetical protein